MSNELEEGSLLEYVPYNFTGKIKYTYSGNLVWFKNGNRHRIGAPASIYPNGDFFWYFEGKNHRTDGAAITYDNAIKKYYWILDSQITSKATLFILIN